VVVVPVDGQVGGDPQREGASGRVGTVGDGVGDAEQRRGRPHHPEEVSSLHEFVESLGFEDDEPFDHRSYPCYDEHWLIADPASPQCAALTARMREIGIFDAVGLH
jgi:hypothetical protein